MRLHVVGFFVVGTSFMGGACSTDGIGYEGNKDGPRLWTPTGRGGNPLLGDELPAWQTQEELRLSASNAHAKSLGDSNPPRGKVYGPAEFASIEGVIIAPYSGADYFGGIARSVVDAGAIPYILVTEAEDIKAITNGMLEPFDVAAEQVEFIHVETNTTWSRDYGPWHIYVDGERAIVDQAYFSGRQDDDDVPVELGDHWNEEVFATGLSTEGGNYMTDGLGTCWVSTGVLRHNRSHLSREAIQSIYRDYVGCETLTFIEPIPGEGTTHIDMFSKVLNQDTIMVAYSAHSLGAKSREIDALERAADAYRDSPKPGGGRWNIVRIPMVIRGYWQRTYYTYTNSLIVNDHVLVPTYGEDTDEEALQTYQSTMPGYTIVGIASNRKIRLGGAIHCTTMQVPSRRHRTCGDGVIAGDEQCEAGYLRGASCRSLGFSSGQLTCSERCQYETADCQD